MKKKPERQFHRYKMRTAGGDVMDWRHLGEGLWGAGHHIRSSKKNMGGERQTRTSRRKSINRERCLLWTSIELGSLEEKECNLLRVHVALGKV